jgi:uncharacterized protein involved in propanediol utilization
MALDPSLQKLVAPLADSAWTLAALSAATLAGVIAALVEAESIATLAAQTRVPAPMLDRLLDVLANLGRRRLDRDGGGALEPKASARSAPAA